MLKIGELTLIPHIHKLFNIAVKQDFPTPWIRSLIILIFKSSNKNNPSNYYIIMINPLLAKLYGIILEKRINEWLEMEGTQFKCQTGFRRNHSTRNHLVMLRIIVEECRNNKYGLFCCFVDFRKVLIHCLEITCGLLPR